jgi:hypothetical protein
MVIITTTLAYKKFLVTFLNTTQYLEITFFPTANTLSDWRLKIIPEKQFLVQLKPLLEQYRWLYWHKNL